MFTQTYYFAPGAQILVPALSPGKALLTPMAFGPSLTIPRGQAIGIKTSNKLAYAFNKDASDGTQNFAGFNQVSGATDSNGMFYPVFSGTPAGIDFYATGLGYSPVFTSGIFDPQLLLTSPAGTPTAEVDTVTPTNPTTGDVYTVTTPTGLQATFTVGSTQTAAAVVTGLAASWNANPDLVAIATTSGTGTLILTGATKGVPLNLVAGVDAGGTGTVALVITTAAVTGQSSGVITITPTGTVTTGDVWTLTITWPNATTHTVTATVGSTATAAAIVALLTTAWNNDGIAAGIATATGSTTLILTATQVGNIPPVTSAVAGTGTVSQSTTTPAYGRNIADIQISRPSAYILQPYGFWELP